MDNLDKAREQAYSFLSWETYDWDSHSELSKESESLLSDGVKSVTCTPDMSRLNLVDSHYVFIYNEMKQNFSKSNVIEEDSPVGVGFTKTTFNLFYCQNSHLNFPVVMLDKDYIDKRHPVYGEVYQLSPTNIRRIDYLMSNNFMTKRMKIPIEVVVDGQGTLKQVYAFTYIHLNNYWSGGERKKYLKHMTPFKANQGKKYYNYIKLFDKVIH